MPEPTPAFPERFAELFGVHFQSIFRYLTRLCGDADLAADIAQEAFVRLYQRGSEPDVPGAWLVSVAMNLLRNTASTQRRRLRLLTPARGAELMADAPAGPEQVVEADEVRRRVRSALDRIPERERGMLLLQAEGFSYREIAAALHVNEASVGVLLARARKRFRDAYEESTSAS